MRLFGWEDFWGGGGPWCDISPFTWYTSINLDMLSILYDLASVFAIVTWTIITICTIFVIHYRLSNASVPFGKTKTIALTVSIFWINRSLEYAMCHFALNQRNKFVILMIRDAWVGRPSEPLQSTPPLGPKSCNRNPPPSGRKKIPLYLVLKGSKKIFGAFGAEKHP